MDNISSESIVSLIVAGVIFISACIPVAYAMWNSASTKAKKAQIIGMAYNVIIIALKLLAALFIGIFNSFGIGLAVFGLAWLLLASLFLRFESTPPNPVLLFFIVDTALLVWLAISFQVLNLLVTAP